MLQRTVIYLYQHQFVELGLTESFKVLENMGNLSNYFVLVGDKENIWHDSSYRNTELI